jgi:hypothetical protein
MIGFFVYARAKAKGTLSEERQPKSMGRRLNRIQSAVDAMWTKINRDLRSNDPNRFLTALAVALMSETNEEDVIGWRKKNIAMDDFGTNYRRAGRKKPIANELIVRALKNAYEVIEDGDDALFHHDMGSVTAEMVDDYLDKFKLSMKDLRGLNASQEMSKRLMILRAKGPELPKNKRSRSKLLRNEFLSALDATADSVGLQADVIRNQFLPPGLEASYCEDGNLGIKSANSQDLAARVATRYIRTT